MRQNRYDEGIFDIPSSYLFLFPNALLGGNSDARVAMPSEVDNNNAQKVRRQIVDAVVAAVFELLDGDGFS